MSQKVLPFGLTESPATCEPGLVGTRYFEFSSGKEFVLCKNTSAAALNPGVAVTLETASSHAVDLAIASTNEFIFGVVSAGNYTGTTIAVNDYFWVQTKGQCYVSKGLATASAAIAVNDVLCHRSLGAFYKRTGTIGAKSLTEYLRGGYCHALSAVASSATTRVLAYLRF